MPNLRPGVPKKMRGRMHEKGERLGAGTGKGKAARAAHLKIKHLAQIRHATFVDLVLVSQIKPAADRARVMLQKGINAARLREAKILLV